MSQLRTRLENMSPDARQRLAEALRARRAEAGRIPCAPRDGRDFPLSFNQERLWFLDQLAPANAFYNVSLGQQIGRVDAGALQKAIDALVLRHEILRTIFPSVGGAPVQRILPDLRVPLDVVSLERTAPLSRDAEARRLAADRAALAFDLGAGPLLRPTLIVHDRARASFVLTVHHILVDAWSMRILMRELGQLYTAECGGQRAGLPPLTAQYADYALWQRGQFDSTEDPPELGYWRDALHDLPTLALPHDRPRKPIQNFVGGQVGIRLPPELSAAVRACASRHDTTAFVVLLSGFFGLLHRYSDQEDIAVGVPTANRSLRDVEEMVGFFTNPIVLRGDLSGAPQFTEVIRRIAQTTLKGLENQHLPFSRLVNALQPCPDLARNPLFQVSFQLLARDPLTPAADPAASDVPIDRGSAVFDLSLDLWETGTGIDGQAEYNSDLFDRATVDRLVRHYLEFLRAAVAEPETPVADLPLMTPDELSTVIDDWSGRADFRPPPKELLDHKLLESCARHGARVAVREGAQTLTFAALAARSAALSARLAAAGCKRGRRVGILMSAGLDLPVAILSVLRAGAAFVPLDAGLPDARLLAMIEDAGVRILLTDAATHDRLTPKGVMTLRVDADQGADPPTVPKPVARSPEDVAYVTFTSGSTGRPKGVMIPHRGVVNYLDWCAATYPHDAEDGAPLCSPITSDMSITALFLPLLNGKTVEMLDSRNAVEALERRLSGGARYDFVKLTPSHLDALRTLSTGQPTDGSARAFIVGGEALSGEMLAPWASATPDLMIFNEYGPTEATVGCCVHGARAASLPDGPVPIGRPIASTLLYVLDRHGAPVPAGIPGELFIGGAGVALGYIGQPELTAERFVPDPHRPGHRVYRTGDRVRWRGDGVLEYLGRTDDQLKILGYRVEPGEIETALRRAPDIQDAAVIAQDTSTGDTRLVAFVTPLPDDDSDTAAWVAQVKSRLGQNLPRHMIPARIERIAALPLTPTGKVDRRQLAARQAGPAPRRSAAVPPRDALETLICRVWGEVLGNPRIGIEDDFFGDLGGHSLLAARAIARLRDVLETDIALRSIFEAPCAADFAQVLRAASGDVTETEASAALVLEVLDMSEDRVREMLNEDPS